METQLRKEKEKREDRSRTEQEAFGINSGFLCVDCIAKLQRAERKLRRMSRPTTAVALRYFLFHRNRKFTAQQRGLDFALVQARHSSKVISYFATKALSTSVFLKRPGLEKQSRSLKYRCDFRRLVPLVPLPFDFPG